MRPKKRILLIDADEYRRSVRAYTLYINRFCVISAASVEEAASMAISPGVDLVIGVWPIGKSFAAIARAPSLLICEDLLEYPSHDFADAILLKPSGTELIERVMIMAARKRGPKVGWKKPVSSDGAELNCLDSRETA